MAGTVITGFSSILLLTLVVLSSATAPITWVVSLNPPLASNGGLLTDLFQIENPVAGYYNGLTYFAGSSGYGAIDLYSIRGNTGAPSWFDTIDPTSGTVTDRFDCSSTANTINVYTIAFAAQNLGYGENNYYYLRTDTSDDDATKFGYIIPGGTSGVSVDVTGVVLPKNMDSLTFASSVVRSGGTSDTFYTLRHDEFSCQSYFSELNLLTLAFADLMPLGVNFDALFFTPLDVGWGVNKFYYLRHDIDSYSTFGMIDPEALQYTDLYSLGQYYNQISFIPDAVNGKTNLFYLLRGAPFTTCTAYPFFTISFSGNALTLNSAGTNLSISTLKTTNKFQQWYMTSAGYIFSAALPNVVLDVTNNATKSASPVATWHPKNGTNQYWQFSSQTTGGTNQLWIPGFLSPQVGYITGEASRLFFKYANSRWELGVEEFLIRITAVATA